MEKFGRRIDWIDHSTEGALRVVIASYSPERDALPIEYERHALLVSITGPHYTRHQINGWFHSVSI